jgi:hypothetical protein
MDEPVGVGVWRKKDRLGNWISEKSEFDADASKKRADHLDHFLKLPSFQQRYELEVKSRDSVRDARKCAGESETLSHAAPACCLLANRAIPHCVIPPPDDAAATAARARAAADRALELSSRLFSSEQQ